MGHCHYCKVELTLREGENSCQNLKCQEKIRYNCWKCGNIILVEKERNLQECKLCGFFICQSCGECGKTCEKKQWQRDLLTIKKDLTNKELDEIIKYFEIAKTNKERKNCIFNVPISYGKGAIKKLYGLTQGIKTKSQADIDKFNQRLGEIENKAPGQTFTISQIREPGTYGKEYRDAANLSICLGKLKFIKKVIEIPNKNNKKKPKKQEYWIYERINGEQCLNFDIKDIVIRQCEENSDHVFSFFTQGNCSQCQAKLKLTLANRDICQLSRSDFKIKSQ